LPETRVVCALNQQNGKVWRVNDDQNGFGDFEASHEALLPAVASL